MLVRHCEERPPEADPPQAESDEAISVRDCFVGLRPPRNDGLAFLQGSLQ